MTIPTLRTIRTTVYDNFGVRLKFIQASRHRLEGVLKFSARLGNWLTDAGNKRSNFQNFQIPNLSVTGVRLMSKYLVGTRGPGVRHSSVGCLRNNVDEPFGCTPARNWLKFGQHMHLLKANNFSFMSDSCQMAGFVRTGRTDFCGLRASVSPP